MWNCFQCQFDLDEPTNECRRCKRSTGIPSNIIRAWKDREHLQNRYRNATAGDSNRDILTKCEEVIRAEMQVSINAHPESLVGFLSDPSFRYLNLHDNLRSRAKLHMDPELIAKRTGLDHLLFGIDGPRSYFGALNLGTNGVYSYGCACLYLKSELIRNVTSFLEQNTFDYYNYSEEKGLIINVPTGIRAVWHDAPILAVVKHAEELLSNPSNRVLPGLATTLLSSGGNKQTDQFIEAQMCLDITRDHVRHIILNLAHARPPKAVGLVGATAIHSRKLAEVLVGLASPDITTTIVHAGKLEGSHP